jgi:PAS domain S-box-containing protein
MSLIIILSITIRLAAMGWSIVLLRRMRDWRMGFLTAMLGLMALRQTLTLLMTRESWSISFTAQATEMPGLVVSILAFAAVIFLERIIMEEEKVKKEMRESEERSRLLLDSTAEGIYGLDLQGNCTFCNPACLRLLGYEDVEDLLGKNVHELIHHTRPDGSPYPEEECRIYQAFRQGKGTHVDDEVLWRADGTSFPAEYWSYPIRRNGELIGSVVTFLDITERRQAEEALHKTSRALKVLGSCNSALVRATEESELLREVCRVIVEVGGYRLAWVGFAEQDEEKSVRPVAQAGYEQGYLET